MLEGRAIIQSSTYEGVMAVIARIESQYQNVSSTIPVQSADGSYLVSIHYNNKNRRLILWIVSQLGFYNIVCQDGDEEKGLLTIKARDCRDLEAVKQYITTSDIEHSDQADYKFRVKARADRVSSFVAMLVDNIDYPKTKPRLAEDRPERSEIYLNVWGDLLRIQDDN